MPGPAIHHIVGREFLHNVLQRNYQDPESIKFWNEIYKGYYAPVYNLGCQGPDFLFFNSNDWPLGGGIKPLAKIYLELMSFMEDFKKALKELIPDEIWALISALETLAEDAVERSVLLTEISELITAAQNNMGALSGIINSGIKEFITDNVDVFNLLSHPQHDGQAFKEWWWFDTLHVRRTGRFTQTLLDQSKHGSMERAYALGYLTHYSADISGHAFVNAISGGPYRTHSQRHKVIENHHDVWAYKKYMKDEFVKSNLAKDYIIAGDSFKLPKDLKKFILNCVEQVYYKNGSPDYGKPLNADDLDIAYSLWLKWFTSTTNESDLPEPKPYSLTAEFAQAWDQFTDNVGDIGDMINNSASGGFGIFSFFAMLAAAIVGAVLLAAAIIDYLAGNVMTLAAAPIRIFLSLTYESLYSAYMSFRRGVVMNGFAFPFQSGLTDPLTSHMINTSFVDRFGHNAISLPNAKAYPAKEYKIAGMEAESHLIYPWPSISNLEKDECRGFPDNYFNKTPEWYINDPKHVFMRDHYEYFSRFDESNVEKPPAAEVESRYADLLLRSNGDGMGNALEMGKNLYSDFLKLGVETKFADFNMDSDRGYAFKSWRKVKDISYINSPINDHNLTNVAVTTDDSVRNIQTDIINRDGGVL